VIPFTHTGRKKRKREEPLPSVRARVGERRNLTCGRLRRERGECAIITRYRKGGRQPTPSWTPGRESTSFPRHFLATANYSRKRKREKRRGGLSCRGGRGRGGERNSMVLQRGLTITSEMGTYRERSPASFIITAGLFWSGGGAALHSLRDGRILLSEFLHGRGRRTTTLLMGDFLSPFGKLSAEEREEEAAKVHH